MSFAHTLCRFLRGNQIASGFVVNGFQFEVSLVDGDIHDLGEGLAVRGQGVGGDDCSRATLVGNRLGDNQCGILPLSLGAGDAEGSFIYFWLWDSGLRA
jgi:hypothetical protein